MKIAEHVPFVIWWIKRDIRLADNPALHAALQKGLPVVPFFVFEPSVLFAPESSSMHAYAQCTALQRLQESLRRCGSDLCWYRGSAESAFAAMAQHGNLQAVFSQEETGTETTFSRDRHMAAWFSTNHILWKEQSQGGVIRRVGSRETWERSRTRFYSEQPLPTPTTLPALPASVEQLASHPLPSLSELGFSPGSHRVQRVGEPEAWSILEGFLAIRSKGYRYSISSPNTAFEHGSRLSPHLAWGTISSRSVLHRVAREQQAQGISEDRARDLLAFRSRIHWRDHFMQRLETEPGMEFAPLNPLFADLPYRNDPDLLNAWLTGTTGFPIVDASMRCLSQTGFLNFRMRAMVTSFATHALRLDWKTINEPMAGLMLDYEPGIHLSQIQMQAGVTGMNTLRVYSPAKQLAEQDPRLIFVRKWIPELRTIPDEVILSAGNTTILGYQPTVVDFAAETKLMKDVLYAIKKSPENKVASAQVWKQHGSRMRRPTKSK